MKLYKTLFLALLPFFFSFTLNAQISGLKTVCTFGCDYPNLTGAGGAFEDINLPGGINGDLILEIQSDLTEDGSVELGDYNDNGSPYTITIRPDGPTMHIVTGDNSGDGIISILGGDRVIIDGRDPGNTTSSYTNRYLTIQNTNLNSPAISISADAVSCSLRSVIFESGNTSTSGGVIVVGGGTLSGNDDLTIDFCDIKDYAGNIPVNGIFLGGGATNNNDNIKILSNRIFDFYPIDISGGYGIDVDNNNSGTIIDGNSIYQTTNRSLSGVAGYPYGAIRINSPAGSGFKVINNFIGGTQENCGGTTPIFSAPATGSVNAKLISIEDVGFATATEVSGNVIKKIATLNAASNGLTQGALIAITIKRGAIDVENNIIGDATDGLTATFDATAFASSGLVAGIYYQTYASGLDVTGSIISNQIDNMSVTKLGAVASGATEIAGIFVDQQTGTQPILIKKNSIGNLSGPITMTTNNDANNVLKVIGIDIFQASTSITVDRNKIANFSCKGLASGSYVRGISSIAAANISISRNHIFNLSSDANNPSSSGAASAVYVSNNSTTGVSIVKNVIYHITNTNAVVIGGIIIGAVSPGVNPAIENNMISLGDTQTSDSKFYGIYNNTSITGSLKVSANSVAVTGPGSVGNTNDTFSFYRESSSSVSLQSNLFFNNRMGGANHYAIGTNSTSGFSSDYNLLFASSSPATGFFGSTGYDFAGWQTATGGDANSKNADVSSKFISLNSGNLRIPDDGSLLVSDNVVDKGSASIATNPVNDDVDEAHRSNLTDIGSSEVLLTWTGAINSDWTNTGNWSGGVIPSCGGRELIKIGPGVPNDLNINIAAEFSEFVVLEGATVSMSGAGSLTQCSTVSSPYSLVVNGTFTVSGSQPINLYGDFNQNGTFNAGTGSLNLINSLPQIIDGDDASVQITNLTIDGGGAKTLNQPVNISGMLTLTNGLLNTTSTNIITFTSGSGYSGGSTASYINGPVAKITNSTSEFFFPVGKGGKYRIASITPTSTSSTTFTAEYFDVSAIATYSFARQASLKTISNVEYWIISRSGASNGKIRLTWDAASGVSAVPADRAKLCVVRWNGSQWTNMGGTASGTQPSGNVISNNILSFSPFTLGSLSDNNPLPVELVNLQANAFGPYVKISWETTSEVNNDYFIVESSQSGEEFKMVTQISGKGTGDNHQYYSAWDHQPYSGTSYYRLKQVDLNGSSTYSAVVQVTMREDGHASIQTYPNPIRSNGFTIALKSFKENSPVHITITDVAGKVQQQQMATTNDDGFVELKVVNEFASGLYLIKAYNGIQSYVDKIIISK